MAKPADASPEAVNRRKKRKQRARRKLIRRLLSLVLIGVLVLLLWQNWDTVAPDKLLARLQDSMSNSGSGWPVDISGSGATKLVQVQGYTAVLSDSYLTYYNDSGNEVKRYPYNYSAPLLRHAGKYVLLAEQEGCRAQLTIRSMLLAEVTAEEKILSAAVNSKGQFALLTQGPQGYAVKAAVYNHKGEQIYARSRMTLASDVAISQNGSQIAVLSVQAQNGELSSMVEVFNTNSSDPEALYTYTAQGQLLYRLAYIDDQLVAVGEERAVMINSAGQAAVYTGGNARILGYGIGSSYLALVMRDYGETAGGRLVVVGKSGEEKARVPFTGAFRHISANGNAFMLLTDSMVQTVTPAGAGKQAAVAADGQRAVFCGNQAVVLGLNSLQIYPLATADASPEQS